MRVKLIHGDCLIPNRSVVAEQTVRRLGIRQSRTLVKTATVINAHNCILNVVEATPAWVCS